MSTVRSTAGVLAGFPAASVSAAAAADRHDGVVDTQLAVHQPPQDEDVSPLLQHQTVYHSNASNPYYFQGNSLMTYVNDNLDHPWLPFAHLGPQASGGDKIGPYEDDLEMSDSDGGAPLADAVEAVAAVEPTAVPLSSPDDVVMELEPPAPAEPAHQAASHGDLPSDPVPTQEYHESSLQAVGHDDSVAPPFDAGEQWSDMSDTASIADISPAVPASSAGSSFAISPEAVSQQLQQLQADVAELDTSQPPPITNLHPNSLGPDNLGWAQFLTHWAYHGGVASGANPSFGQRPDLGQLQRQVVERRPRVRYDQLRGNSCDMQGVDWQSLRVSRRTARERRMLTYKNYTNKPGSDTWHHDYDEGLISSKDSFFRFRRMDIRRNVHLAHFQLRSVLACPSRSRAFYPGQKAIYDFNPVSSRTSVAMNLQDLEGVQVSTLAAGCGILVAGTFNGEYCLTPVDSEDKAYTQGRITDHPSGITNHLQIHESRRSSGALVAFASNDKGFRVMDVETESYVSDILYDFPMNCSALSPDRRLRVMVGDHYNVLITNAETGEILQELTGHRDFGFACDWADDGWTVATGFQDKGVKIWDARRWTNSNGIGTPLRTIRCEMAGARCLRFSPQGSGKRVLVAAEEADFINIIDGQTFKSKQTFDIFGEIGGVDFTNEGQDLNVLCCDRDRGGLLQLERCNFGVETAWELDEAPSRMRRGGRRNDFWRPSYGWRASTEENAANASSAAALAQRRARSSQLEEMAPF